MKTLLIVSALLLSLLVNALAAVRPTPAPAGCRPDSTLDQPTYTLTVVVR